MPSFEIVAEREIVNPKTGRKTLAPKSYVVKSPCVTCGMPRVSIHRSVELATDTWDFYHRYTECKRCYVPSKRRTASK